jgi:glutaredoxin-like protein
MQLGERERRYVLQKFQGLKDPVRLVMFTQETECEFCADTRALVEQVASLSPLLSAEVYNFVLDREKATEYRVDKIPAIAIVGAADYGLRYYGIPAGYEFAALIEDIVDVSRGDSGLSAESRSQLKQLDAPVHLQVFTTPT